MLFQPYNRVTRTNMDPIRNSPVPGTSARVSDHVRLLLLAGYRNAVTTDCAESAFGRIQDIVGHSLDPVSFHDAVAVCLRDGLIREPVRLPENSLQCHWRLELTATGMAVARSLIGTR
jgi:hypothetical protein